MCICVYKCVSLCVLGVVGDENACFYPPSFFFFLLAAKLWQISNVRIGILVIICGMLRLLLGIEVVSSESKFL